MKSKLKKLACLLVILSCLANLSQTAFGAIAVIAFGKEPEVMTFLFIMNEVRSNKGNLTSIDLDRIDSAIAFISQSPNDFEGTKGNMINLLEQIKTLLTTQAKTPLQIKQDRKKALATIDEFLGYVYGE